MKLTCGVEHLPKRNEEKVMQFYELIGRHSNVMRLWKIQDS